MASAPVFDRFPSSTARTKNHLKLQVPMGSESEIWAQEGVVKTKMRNKVKGRFTGAKASRLATTPTPIATKSGGGGLKCLAA